MKFFRAIGRGITKVNEMVANVTCLLIFPLTFVICLEVIFRYFLNRPLIYSYDLTWMMYAAFVFLGGGYALANEVHVRADVFYAKLKRRGKLIINILCYPAFFFTSMFALCYATFNLMVNAWVLNEASPFTSWNPPVWPIRTVLFISMALLTLQGIVKFIQFLGEKEVKEIKEAEGGEEA